MTAPARTMRRSPRHLGPALLLLLVSAMLALTGCRSTPVSNRDPVGERFPSVTGTSLAGDRVRLPDDLAGEPALLLVGYAQNAQFDLDRWLLGYMQAEMSIAVLEVPTIKGLIPGMFAGSIDSGMRGGIPSEDWATVVTVYGDAGDIVKLTGTQKKNNGRILLLDREGEIVWFHDRGYSAGKMMELVEAAKRL